MALTTEQLAKRLLVVVYDMSDGRTDRSFKKEAIWSRANALGVHEMTDEEFRTYHATVVERVKALRAETCS